jgi:hypothetical protein
MEMRDQLYASAALLPRKHPSVSPLNIRRKLLSLRDNNQHGPALWDNKYLNIISVNFLHFDLSQEPKLTAVGIRCADHATPSIR